ncbi:MAG: hypothetical protein WC827_01020 [Candidatus Paceibacterota bacterium]|jgi:hypothetical protein
MLEKILGLGGEKEVTDFTKIGDNPAVVEKVEQGEPTIESEIDKTEDDKFFYKQGREVVENLIKFRIRKIMKKGKFADAEAYARSIGVEFSTDLSGNIEKIEIPESVFETML